jgi:Protein of unknown function (DUF2971)
MKLQTMDQDPNSDKAANDDLPDWKAQYFRWLNRPRRTEVDLEAARLLKEKNLPVSLYKYANFRSLVTKEDAEKLSHPVEGQPWTAVNLRSKVVALRPPATFNDPFDSCLSFISRGLINNLLTSRGKRPLEGTPLAAMQDAPNADSLPEPEDRLEEEMQAGWRKAPDLFGPYPRYKRIMESVFQSQDESMVSNFATGTRAALRVGCFSETNDSIVMWSHYADHHRGICIEYETRRLSFPGGLGFLHPVNYHPDLFDATGYFQCSPSDSNNLMLTIAACHKAPEWAYEREWRLVDVAFRDKHPIVPSRIILGAGIEDSMREEMRRISTYLGVQLQEASLSRRTFQIVISPSSALVGT